MLSCKDITHKADEFLDMKLPWRTRVAFKIHLFMCVNCRRYISQIQLTIKTLAGMSKPAEPDESFISNLTQMYRDNNKK
ncbi:MAG: zf-HC2 domain-containing protein [Gammaproteobacteria bacterium]|nr:zf-HC2 domain-containing protein [Gammaproteobacteria bacterium]MDH5800506.1 zf-HC2 domain-containing protein [Gammaproteobacteria bacterium]